MKIILSIKPEFAVKIFNGSKKYEFRRSIFRNDNVKSVVVYVSSPVKKIIGEFEIEEVLNHDIDTLWGITKKDSGISEDYFFKYFTNKRSGFAIKIKRTKKYRTPKNIKSDFNLSPPQSFVYLSE